MSPPTEPISELRSALAAHDLERAHEALLHGHATLSPPRFDELLSYLHAALPPRRWKDRPDERRLMSRVARTWRHPDALPLLLDEGARHAHPFAVIVRRIGQLKTHALQRRSRHVLPALLTLRDSPHELGVGVLRQLSEALPLCWYPHLLASLTAHHVTLLSALSEHLRREPQALLSPDGEVVLEMLAALIPTVVQQRDAAAAAYPCCEALLGPLPDAYLTLREALLPHVASLETLPEAVRTPWLDLFALHHVISERERPPTPKDGLPEHEQLAERLRALESIEARLPVLDTLLPPSVSLTRAQRLLIAKAWDDAPRHEERLRLASLVLKLSRQPHDTRIARRLLSLIRPWSEDGNAMGTRRAGHASRRGSARRGSVGAHAYEPRCPGTECPHYPGCIWTGCTSETQLYATLRQFDASSDANQTGWLHLHHVSETSLLEALARRQERHAPPITRLALHHPRAELRPFSALLHAPALSQLTELRLSFSPRMEDHLGFLMQAQPVLARFPRQGAAMQRRLEVMGRSHVSALVDALGEALSNLPHLEALALEMKLTPEALDRLIEKLCVHNHLRSFELVTHDHAGLEALLRDPRITRFEHFWFDDDMTGREARDVTLALALSPQSHLSEAARIAWQEERDEPNSARPSLFQTYW